MDWFWYKTSSFFSIKSRAKQPIIQPGITDLSYDFTLWWLIGCESWLLQIPLKWAKQTRVGMSDKHAWDKSTQCEIIKLFAHIVQHLIFTWHPIIVMWNTCESNWLFRNLAPPMVLNGAPLFSCRKRCDMIFEKNLA